MIHKKIHDSGFTVWDDPDDEDSNEADWYEEDVKEKQQTVNDESDVDPLLWAEVSFQLLLHLKVDGFQIPVYFPEHLHTLVLIQGFLLLRNVVFCNHWRGIWHFYLKKKRDQMQTRSRFTKADPFRLSLTLCVGILDYSVVSFYGLCRNSYQPSQNLKNKISEPTRRWRIVGRAVQEVGNKDGLH